MKWLIFLLIIPTAKADALLDAIYADWGISKMESTPDYSDESNYSETPDSSEPEFYSWELGNPDNIPEIEIIYDEPNPCQLGY